jgi:protein-disulfide isomerase
MKIEFRITHYEVRMQIVVNFRYACVTALALLSTVGLAGCSKGSTANAEAASVREVNSDLPKVLAKIGDEPITIEQIREVVGPALDKLETQYQLQRSQTIVSGLEQILEDRVLGEEAKKQGKTLDELVMAEAGGTFEPTDVEISTWYQENQGKVRGRPLDQVRVQIADYLRKKKREEAQARLGLRLNRERKVAMLFEPYRMSFNNAGAPTLGKSGARVQVVEFSDFQCPFCRQFAPNLRLIEKQFGDQVEVIYRQYPIPSLHPFAIKAAEASLCAQEQGKFWELHDMMFAEQDRIAVSDLKSKARRLGMNGGKFDSCLDTGKYTEQVQRDMAEGVKSGVNGTPAIFVNGIEVPGGAVPLETITNAIQKEIDRSAQGK